MASRITIFKNDTRAAQALIIGLALIVATVIGGIFYRVSRPPTGVLSVTGSAKQEVTSDTAKLTVSIQKTVPQSALTAGYTQIAASVASVKALIAKAGGDASSSTVTPVTTYQHYENNQSYTGEQRYDLSDTVEFQTADVALATNLSQSVTNLSKDGLVVSVSSLEYYYSKLADLRVSLLGDAIKDAQARAKTIAENSGRTIGAIESAASGVVQVLPVNSVDVTSGGAYDTAHIEKEVMVTVKATFGVK
ncbi:MAG TPA: SIMPL domain-containing protein [Candidatus Paceibacterota bacterium]|nr:SIMPL domain-containing protein [Candidatus Paceibacterota bacterium]